MCRVIGDFGTEHSYRKARERIIEHYGIEIAPSAIRGVTMEVAEQCTEHLRKQYDQDYRKLPSEGKEVVIAQIDGSMVCVVEAGKREAKRPRVYREIRLAMAVAHEEVEPHYAATFESVQEIGRRWGHCALLAGRGLDSKMHVIADGAPWIEIQNREVFGTGRSLLCDFYHVSEYLAQAAQICRPEKPKQWLKTQQKRLKRGALKEVMRELGKNIEGIEIPEEEAPVRSCHRYLNNRIDCLDYAQAKEQGLPIGSGLIESGHKHVLQARLKQPGMAWLVENAEKMAQARVVKANGLWAAIWN